MGSFQCEHCNKSIIEKNGVFITECRHYPMEIYEERSAIMEFDGGLTREEAEKLARLEIYRR